VSERFFVRLESEWVATLRDKLNFISRIIFRTACMKVYEEDVQRSCRWVFCYQNGDDPRFECRTDTTSTGGPARFIGLGRLVSI